MSGEIRPLDPTGEIPRPRRRPGPIRRLAALLATAVLGAWPAGLAARAAVELAQAGWHAFHW